MKTETVKLVPTTTRHDIWCTQCEQITSIYVHKGDKKPRTIYCGRCGDNFTEKYNSLRHGSFRGRMKNWTVKEDRLLHEYVGQGMKWREIGEKMGRSAGSVRARCEQIGLEKPDTRFWPDEDIEILKEALDKPLTWREIGLLFNPPRKDGAIREFCRIRGWVKKYNFQRGGKILEQQLHMPH